MAPVTWAVTLRTPKGHLYRQLHSLRTMTLRTEWQKGEDKKEEPAPRQASLQGSQGNCQL